MTFLPESDRDFFEAKEIVVEEIEEGETKGVIIRDFSVPPGLYFAGAEGLAPCEKADVLVMVPRGYNDTKLDSFYTDPPLLLPNGIDPQNCSPGVRFANRSWQFWSRHQPEGSWRPGIDGFPTYLQLIREALRAR